MSLAVIRRSHNGGPSSITGPVRVRCVADTQALVQVISPSTSVSPCHYRSTNVPHSPSFTRCSYQRQTGDGLSEIDKY
jgi:hypothetical protein